MLRHFNGDSTLSETDFISQLLELQGQILGARAERLSFVRNWFISKSGLDRLLLEGAYANLGQAVPGAESGMSSSGLL